MTYRCETKPTASEAKKAAYKKCQVDFPSGYYFVLREGFPRPYELIEGWYYCCYDVYPNPVGTPAPPSEPEPSVYTILGTVKHKITGAPLEGVKINLFGQAFTYSFFGGGYTYKLYAGFSGAVTASLSGYETSTKYLTTQSGVNVVDFELSPLYTPPPAPAPPPTPEPTPPPPEKKESEPNKRWREWQQNPTVINLLGTLPDTTLNAFTRVFSSWDIFEEKTMTPDIGHYVSAGLILGGIGLASIGAIIALMPVLAGAELTLGGKLIDLSYIEPGLKISSASPILTKIMGWATSPNSLKGIVAAAVGLIGLDTFIDFMGEEAAQTAGMGVWVLIDSKDYTGANEALKKYKIFVEHLKNKVEAVGILNPIAYSAFKNYYQASEAQAESYQKEISKHIKAVTPEGPAAEEREPAAPVFKINIDSTPSNAKLYIDGFYTHHLTPSSDKELKDVMGYLTPGKHKIMVTKKNMSAEKEVEITDGDNGQIILDLTTPTMAMTKEAIQKQIDALLKQIEGLKKLL